MVTKTKSRIKPSGNASGSSFRLHPVSWSAFASDIMKVRMSVFVHEQRVPLDEEIDEHDPNAYHIVVYDKNKKPVATARLTRDGWIGRMAVMPAYRKHGIGHKMLLHLMKKAVENGHRIIELSAQTHAIPFYQKCGFTTVGRVFDDAGIPHQKMIYIHKPKSDKK